jgi:hypothetical protein
MAKTKRQDITIPLLPDHRPYVIEKATVFPEGLAVHKNVLRDGTSGKFWTITHVPTGYSFGVHFDTQRHAKKVAEKLIETGIYWRGKTDVKKITVGEKNKALSVLEMYRINEPG